MAILANEDVWTFLRAPFAISALSTFAIILVALLVWIIVGRLASRDVADENVAHRIRRNILSVTMLLTVIAIATIWAVYAELALVAGLIGAGVALGMQSAILCLGGWFVITTRKIYDVGDRIEIDGTIGDVVDIGLMHTTLLEVSNLPDAEQSTGRIVTIPNKVIYTSHVFNHTKWFPLVWNDLRVAVTFESNWEQAKLLMLEFAQANVEKVRTELAEHVRGMHKKIPIRFPPLTPIVYTQIVEYGVELSLRYLTGARRRRGMRTELSERILRAFDAAPDVSLAYPTQRITGVGPAAPAKSTPKRRKRKPPAAEESR